MKALVFEGCDGCRRTVKDGSLEDPLSASQADALYNSLLPPITGRRQAAMNRRFYATARYVLKISDDSKRPVAALSSPAAVATTLLAARNMAGIVVVES